MTTQSVITLINDQRLLELAIVMVLELTALESISETSLFVSLVICHYHQSLGSTSFD